MWRAVSVFSGVLVGAMAAVTAPAFAAGTIYWGNYSGTTISHAQLNDTGGGGDLTMTGATVSNPYGLAINVVAGKIYWANFGGNVISVGRLNGTRAHDLKITGVTVSEPAGIAINPAAGKIYWGNDGDQTIDFANLNGSGAKKLHTGAAIVNDPDGVAIDPSDGKIFWANQGAGIDFANLNDTGGGGSLNTAGATVHSPQALAIDPRGGRVYWANFFGQISFANLDNSGAGADLNTTGATTSGPTFPVLLKAPRATAKPKVSGGTKVGSKLSCSKGKWAPDLLGSFLYQRPVSFSYAWSRNGKPIAGAANNSITAKRAGTYTCTVTAQNQAGHTDKTSASHNVTT